MFGLVEFEDEEENEPLRYTPMYTFYNWEQLTPTLYLSQNSLNNPDATQYDTGNQEGNTLQVRTIGNTLIVEKETSKALLPYSF